MRGVQPRLVSQFPHQSMRTEALQLPYSQLGRPVPALWGWIRSGDQLRMLAHPRGQQLQTGLID